jgi:predicted AAA+ superfamily ATPase
VKYSDTVNADDVSHLRDVKVKKKVVITRNQAGRMEGIELVPLWRFLLECEGAGTLQ